MEERVIDALKHDWQILVAKFLATTNYDYIEDDLILLAEMGCLEALGVYVLAYDEGRNRKIDRMVDGFPDARPNELSQLAKDGWTSDMNIAKSAIKANRRNRFYLRGGEKGEVLALWIKSQAQIYGDQTDDSLRMLVEVSLQFPDLVPDSQVVAYISNLILKNHCLRSDGVMAMLGVANQPYSDYFENYKLARRNNPAEFE